jgi:molybdenum cofactor biosynthesis protein B
MGYHEHKHLSLKNVSCAVLIISDSRTEKDDESGTQMKKRLLEEGHQVSFYAIPKNDAQAIKDKMNELVNQTDVQVIITSGGTGLSHRDVTVDTVEQMLDKKLDGFGELFRSLTFQQIGTGSILSRATAGVITGRVIICIPGSLGAVTLAMDQIILPEIGHLVREATR